MKKFQTSLQVNIYPLDICHLKETLPHQIRVFGDQVDSICIVLDTKPSLSGRYGSEFYSDCLLEIRCYLNELSGHNNKIVVKEVDYSAQTKQGVSDLFFGGKYIPEKAWDGGPFYSYFYGLYISNSEYVLHMDGDMLFGGGSSTWISEAKKIIDDDVKVAFVCPWPGPPFKNGFISEKVSNTFEGTPAKNYKTHPLSIVQDHVSTRIFFAKTSRLVVDLGALGFYPLGVLRKFKAYLLGNEGVALEAESLLSLNMREKNKIRVDYLGENSGVWSLHPVYRSAEYIAALPIIIRNVELGEIPAGQIGDYNLNDSMVDLKSAKKNASKLSRILKQINFVLFKRFFIKRN
ncbi:hypothetical protein [Azonexus hydrophilus]|uniref:hypothetical protein n=1 Tax=Azonexus hydrophilus TaxID=418702 RepID=UPI0011155121|nr:hypothetical protein [Azonexus hydrophilus]